MIHLNDTSTISCLCILLLSTWYFYLRSRFKANRIIHHRSLSNVFHLLNPPNATTASLLVSRSIPNARLIRAFCLTNTFVSADAAVHSTFVNHSNALLRAATQRGWVHFQQISIDAVHAALIASDEVRLDFDTFVQDVTLRTVLVGLLAIDRDVGELKSVDITVVSTLITKLWHLSKRTDPIPPTLLPVLNHHLRILIPDADTYPNPLDYVIPAWETLWRVVATTVAYAHIHQSVDIFEDLFQQPTMGQFRSFTESRSSVEAFVTEVMRLHPPSKRISRAVPFWSPVVSFDQPMFFGARSFFRQECADIESILRSDIWGVDALTFDPLRYHHTRIEPEQERIRWLPFGWGRHRCIATSWAPMAVGLISAAILNRVGEQRECSLTGGEGIGGREGWKGWEVLKQ